MRKLMGSDRRILRTFSYPVYQLKAIGPNTVIAAGGGGNSKTGVPNRIEIIQFDRPAYILSTQDMNEALIPSNPTLVGALNTSCVAIMHMALGCHSSRAAFLFALEGSTCREYFIYTNDLDSSTIAGAVPTEEEFVVSSIGSTQYFHQQHTPSSSDDSHSTTGVSSTTTITKRSARVSPSEVNKKMSVNDNDEEQLSWTCEALHSVSMVPTSALMERRRLDSCSSTGSVSAFVDDGDELTCIASGGAAGYGWCAVGTSHGGVALFDQHILPEEICCSPSPRSPPANAYKFTFDDESTGVTLQPICTLPDASGGRCAPVCDVALSTATFANDAESTSVSLRKPNEARLSASPLLATISGQPMGSLLCIWRLPIVMNSASTKRVKFAMDEKSRNEGDLGPPYSPLLYAEVKMENAHITMEQKQSGPSRSKRSETGMRFRHCEFLRWIHPWPSRDDGLFTFLVTTEQPLSPTTRSVCHLSVWLVPLPPASTTSSPHRVLGLERFAAVPLPPGEIPACIAVHPSSHRGLIALGTMEGSVDVFMISLRAHRLERVYSMPKAHPIFVTSLAFLPPRERNQQHSTPTSNTTPNRLLPQHYELVSSSADRVIRWHSGPSLRSIVLLDARRPTHSFITSKFYLIFWLVLPLLMSFLNAILPVP